MAWLGRGEDRDEWPYWLIQDVYGARKGGGGYKATV